MVSMKQVGLGLNLSTKRTLKREFLEEMERVLPRGMLVQIVEPHYPKAKTGRPPFGIAHHNGAASSALVLHPCDSIISYGLRPLGARPLRRSSHWEFNQDRFVTKKPICVLQFHYVEGMRGRRPWNATSENGLSS